MVKTLLTSILLLIHPVHVSLLSIEFSPEIGALKVFLKVNYDDFLLDSEADKNGAHLLKFTGADKFTADFLEQYVNKKVKITADDTQLSGTLESYTLEDNDLRMNMTFHNVKKITTLKVKNLIMTSIYKDQANMLIVKINDFEDGVKMTPVENEQTFNIK